MFSEKRSNVLHGILLIALFSCSAFYIAEFPFVKNLSFSPKKSFFTLRGHFLGLRDIKNLIVLRMF